MTCHVAACCTRGADPVSGSRARVPRAYDVEGGAISRAGYDYAYCGEDGGAVR